MAGEAWPPAASGVDALVEVAAGAAVFAASIEAGQQGHRLEKTHVARG